MFAMEAVALSGLSTFLTLLNEFVLWNMFRVGNSVILVSVLTPANTAGMQYKKNMNK